MKMKSKTKYDSCRTISPLSWVHCILTSVVWLGCQLASTTEENKKNEHFIWTNVQFCSFWTTVNRQMPWTTHINIHECLRITLFLIGFRLENDCCVNGTFNPMPNNQIWIHCVNKKKNKRELKCNFGLLAKMQKTRWNLFFWWIFFGIIMSHSIPWLQAITDWLAFFFSSHRLPFRMLQFV